MLKTCVATLAAVGVLALSANPVQAGHDDKDKRGKTRMTINAGTTFNLQQVFDDGNPIFPWFHEVRGIVQVSNLGNCTALFQVRIDSGADCEGGHLFCLSGTMTITTLAGDELHADVVGWADPDPNDPKQPASMHLLHYEVTIKDGTEALKGASGRGQIDGAFKFCGADCFCDSYIGVATWLYEGVLRLPRDKD